MLSFKARTLNEWHNFVNSDNAFKDNEVRKLIGVEENVDLSIDKKAPIVCMLKTGSC